MENGRPLEAAERQAAVGEDAGGLLSIDIGRKAQLFPHQADAAVGIHEVQPFLRPGPEAPFGIGADGLDQLPFEQRRSAGRPQAIARGCP